MHFSEQLLLVTDKTNARIAQTGAAGTALHY